MYLSANVILKQLLSLEKLHFLLVDAIGVAYSVI